MKLRQKLSILSMLALAPLAVGCAVVEDGEVGIRKSNFGKVDPTELRTGMHSSWTSNVLVFSTREIIFTVPDLRPQSKDNTIMKEVDVDINYSVDPDSVSELYTNYSKSYHVPNEQGEVLPMQGFIKKFVNTAVNKSFRQYNALDVNTNRALIEQDIVAQLDKVLADAKLADKIKINSVTITGVQLPDNLIKAVNRQVSAQAERNAKEIELETAKLEAQRIAALSGQASQTYVEQIKAEALKTAAEKGSVIFVVPERFTSLHIGK